MGVGCVLCVTSFYFVEIKYIFVGSYVRACVLDIARGNESLFRECLTVKGEKRPKYVPSFNE